MNDQNEFVNFSLQQQTVEALQVLNLAKSQGASRVVVSERSGSEIFHCLCILDASECTHTRRRVKYSQKNWAVNEVRDVCFQMFSSVF